MPTTISGAAGVNNVAPDSVNFEDFKNTLFNGLLSGNGYIKIPVNDQGVKRELIVQWGTTTSATTTFPIAFPTACLQVIPSFGWNSTTSPAGQYNFVSAISATSFSLAKPATDLSGSSSRWLAIGY